jgi:hypothetical protein
VICGFTCESAQTFTDAFLPNADVLRSDMAAKRTTDGESFLRLHPVSKASAIASMKGALALRTLTLEVDDAETVRMEFTGEVTETGEKLQLTPAGKPEQESDTLWANPFSALTATVVDADCPGDTLSNAGASEREKSGGGKLIM